ncbi:LysR family transcriptional regulator [Mesorhizobium sp. INR15]|uniref:LysR family transcriptional regulator n=1 Tax=Mesorhizobium sp. INR15 TaxID=2654248 RepID=UPI0018968D26|nr:LysR family transcriptional regulator [Mesorhizobium sp. INR15]QPC93784.1 LysR family transcriptional regulator [Mesorhizobium sp. INR15]
MTGDIDIRLLRAFVTVADVGTVSRAADRLARTQAAVSMQLQRLESEVGAQLLRRSPRGVSLTEAGEILLAFARKAIALGEDARREIEGRRLVGRVRLGIVEDLAVTRLPSIIADFRRRHPSVEIELTSAGSTDLSKSLSEGKCDIVMADPARFTMAPRGHLSRQLVWVASRMIELDDEAELPLIIFDGACSWQDRMLASLAEAGIGWKVGCRVSTFAALISALRAGLGVGLLLQEGLPHDCLSLNGRLNLPQAPVADFGIYIARNSPKLVEECGDFLLAGFEM